MLMFGVGLVGEGSAQSFCDLWGVAGEKWSPQSRLPGFSHAGYHNGARPIPSDPEKSNVKDFGAIGDGTTDDTEAFRRAIEAAGRGAILIPQGRYVITGTLKIRKPGTVLRGMGPDKTVLFMPKSLQALLPAESYTALGVPKLKYSFGGAFIEVKGKDGLVEIGKVLGPSERGDYTVSCDNASLVKAGDWVQLKMVLDAELGRHLHAGLNAGDDTLSRPRAIKWVACVVSVDGDYVTFDRPLRIDVRPEWGATLHQYRPTVEEVGIEGLTFEFPGVPKKKHLLEEGFNAIQFGNVFNCWVKDVRFVDADLGLKVGGARFLQAEGLTFVESNRKGRTGHHAIWAAGNSQECLFQDFRIETTYVHDLTVEGFSHGNVFRNGSGRSINLDHHRNGPYENLFTNLDVGDPSRLWRSSGRGDRGPHSAARTTAWNLKHDGGKVNAPSRIKEMWPLVNVIGVVGYEEGKDSDGAWIEPINQVIPADLYEAQLRARLAGAR